MVPTPEPNWRQVDASRELLVESQKEAFPYEVAVCGKQFVIHKDVFSPRYFRSTEIFSRRFPYRSKDRVLEIGCGPGITAVLIALKGATEVVAVDINPAAVENTRANARLHDVDDVVSAQESDIYSAIEPGRRFRTIYWNAPFIYVPSAYVHGSCLERALYDPGYGAFRSFLSDAPSFVAPGGRVIVGFGDFGDVDLFQQLAQDAGFRVWEIAREPSEEGGPVQFILFEMHLLGERS